MPEYLARHFGKHLTNQILIEQGKETATSPKKPDEVKDFSDIFNKVCIIDEDQEETGSEADREIELANKKQPKIKTIVDNKPPQIIEVPEDDEEDEAAEDESDDEEKEFPNLKK